MNLTKRLQTHNAGRDPELLALKYLRMHGNAFTFLRGSCHLFYDLLPQSDIFKSAPSVWACGDLHFENFGTYKGDNRLAYFDINDFDEAALAPLSWDLARMLTSLRIGTQGLGLDAKEVRTLCKSFINSYATVLAAGKAYWVERDTASGPVRDLLSGLRDRQRIDHLNKRTVQKGDKRLLRADGEKALPVSPQQREQVQDFMRGFARTQKQGDFFKVLDVARRIAGTGSLGLERYVILVEGKGSPHNNYLLDMKLAAPSSLQTHLKVHQPRWPTEAHRVVTLQQRMQAVPMAFLTPVVMGGRAFILRGLQPSEDRISLEGSKLSVADLMEVSSTMGQLAAWAHLRSAGQQGSVNADVLINFAQQSGWKKELRQVSEECAQRVVQQSHAFDQAYQHGDFSQ